MKVEVEPQRQTDEAASIDRDIQLQRIEQMLKQATPDDVQSVVSDYKTDLSRQARFAHPAHPLSLPPGGPTRARPEPTRRRLSHTPHSLYRHRPTSRPRTWRRSCTRSLSRQRRA